MCTSRAARAPDEYYRYKPGANVRTEMTLCCIQAFHMLLSVRVLSAVWAESIDTGLKLQFASKRASCGSQTCMPGTTIAVHLSARRTTAVHTSAMRFFSVYEGNGNSRSLRVPAYPGSSSVSGRKCAGIDRQRSEPRPYYAVYTNRYVT